ncbi:MAG TPA: site-2 protease family protein [Kofleriaceae bacterium]|nr:site-2 protease family protein [Kofleriaceae bacterium]
MNLSPEDIRQIVIRVFVLVVSVCFHEFGHAYMADRLGDDTPRRQGRVTLNPLAHADPIGTLLLPIVGAIYAAGGHSIGGFGWGRPVQWQPSRVARKWKMSTARILVAVAGPSMNVVLAVLVAGIQSVLISQGVIDPFGRASQIMFIAVGTNFILFFFNLVPAPPLDGGHVAEGFMPYKHRSTFEQYARFGPFIVLAIAMISPLAQIFVIPAKFVASKLYLLMGQDLLAMLMNS